MFPRADGVIKERTTLKKLVGATLCCLVFSAQSLNAQDAGTLQGVYRIEHVQVIASYEPATQHYVVTAARTQITGESRGKGIFRESSKHPVNLLSTKVIGKEIVGHANIVLIAEHPDRLAVTFKIFLNERLKGTLVRGASEFVLPVQLIDGTLQDFSQGKTIKVQTTAAAAEIFQNEVAKGLDQVFANVNSREVVSDDFNQLQASVVVRLSAPIVILISKQQLVIDRITTDYRLSARVKL